MKKIILLASLVMSTSVFAAIQTTMSNRTFETESYATKQQAYEAGMTLMEEFKTMPQEELKYKLVTGNQNVINPSIEVTDMNVVVGEYGNSQGQLQYKAIVDVDYQYKYRD
ncbi:DUF3316 domain-containing protein [Vibrio atypicus]|jgi:hypothetical protein|uniref:DUF3316 domain-containing protein n=1 Tax=Vibrio atypicus TaxID=558271 RepID=UPI001356CAB6|nr:DUF3316 domain-containing protein [Vibrio atypicus]